MSTAETQSPHILIVDDDPDQLRLLVTALNSMSYRVSVALNGDQGYARATVLLPDLILLDVRLPGRNGIATARLLKINPTTRHIPILFLSAMKEGYERVEGLKAGGVDYISKPFHVEEMLERIRIHLELSQKGKILALEAVVADCSLNNTESSSGTPAVNSILMHVATEFILRHLHESSLRSSDVASRLGVSLRRLNIVFEASDGLSAFEFIRQKRMHRAALMLGQSTLTIADLAIEVGYLNSANFSTEFKKFWGKPPIQFRREYQENPEILRQFVISKFKK